MKNTIKKISAIALIATACALLVLGKDVKTITPQSDITLAANSLSWYTDDFSTPQGGYWPQVLYCKHRCGTTKGWSNWYHDSWTCNGYQEYLVRYGVQRCKGCNAILSFDFDDYEYKIRLV